MFVPGAYTIHCSTCFYNLLHRFCNLWGYTGAGRSMRPYHRGAPY